MGYKNYLECERETENTFYNICKQLMQNGEAKINNASTEEYRSTLTKIGIQVKKNELLQNNLIEPIWRTRNRKKSEMRLIRIPTGVKIQEDKGLKKSIFRFFKI